MSSSPHGRKRLPSRPSEENLKKQAKRRAKHDGVKLSAAQHALAGEYGFTSWAKLVEFVRTRRGESHAASVDVKPDVSRMLVAAREADGEAIERCLAQGISPRARAEDGSPLLVLVAKSPAAGEEKLTAAKALIEAGARVRDFGSDNTHALHWAAWCGPVALAETLIRAGALVWQNDGAGHDALYYARNGVAPDKAKLVELLDRPVMRDPAFKAAAKAIQAGDVQALRKLLAQSSGLIHQHAVEPDCYPKDYFRDPALVWFVANNPSYVERMPVNMVEVARVLIEAGADAADLQYTLGLVMTSSPARHQGLQRPLIRLLMEHGAKVKDPWFVGELGHGERDAVEAVFETGVPLTVPAAAGLGRVNDLGRLLESAGADERHAALCLAVINRQLEAARMCLDAGAEVNRFSVCHQHSMPIHQATVNDDVPMMELLVAHGARLDVEDTLWNGTPLGWAIHTKQPRAEAYLRKVMGTPTSPSALLPE